MRTFLTCSLIAAVASLSAQEYLVPLRSNLAYFYPDLYEPVAPPVTENSKMGAAVSLQLPFFDDFSYCTRSPYPDLKLWEDSMVYVNCGYAIAPPSIGVATFDGLNKHGFPYNPLLSLNLSRPADTLTSKPINLQVISATSKTLQPSDSVALVFFYQIRGNGELPFPADSLIVDVFSPQRDRWYNGIWSSPGVTSQQSQETDTTFKKAFIRLDSIGYFQDGFRFRFRNKATTAGNFDHWHVDYVYLNAGLFRNNTNYFDDLTFGTVPSSFIRDYSAIPWQQYDVTEMTDRLNVRIRNNNSQSSNPLNTSYEYHVFNQSGGSLHHYPGGPSNLAPFDSSGYSTTIAHSRAPVSDRFSFPPMTDSTDFLIKHYVFRSGGAPGNDFAPRNDTVVQYQRFRNYYAYDDGSAEQGWYVLGKLARMGIRIRLNKPDTLRGVRIYFDPAGNVNVAENYEFRINVWIGESFGPTTLIHYDSIMKPRYFKTGFKEIPEYNLTQPRVLPAGVYFIGIQQRVESGIVIGFDRNYDSRQHFYFNSGKGWEPSLFGGSIMIRPVFGRYVPPPVTIPEQPQNKAFRVFPNPSSGSFTVEHNETGAVRYSLYHLTGQEILSGTLAAGTTQINTASCAPGVYLLVLRTADKPPQQHRIIMTR